MDSIRKFILAGVALIALAPVSTFQAADAPMPMSLAEWAKGAQLFDGLGSFHRSITTKSAEAQRYFDQGMRLMWPFNHDEASRSFARAAQSIRNALLVSGVSPSALGPNYNLPMMAEMRAKVAWDALARRRPMRPARRRSSRR